MRDLNDPAAEVEDKFGAVSDALQDIVEVFEHIQSGFQDIAR